MTVKLSAHLDAFFSGLSVTDRIAKFAEMGFSGFEFWCWWEDKYNVEQIAKAAEQNNIEVVAACTKFVSLVDSDCHAEYLSGLEETIEACKKLNCKMIISQVGNEIADKSRAEQTRSLIEGLKKAAEVLTNSGMVLVVEPLNILVDHMGYFLARSDETAEIIKAVDCQQVKMLFDIYHQQITEGNIISNIKNYIETIAHFHCAGVPGRAELSGGELDYKAIFKAIYETGYDGYVGLEFFPKKDAEQALKESQALANES